jgi:chemotaxis protein MotB
MQAPMHANERTSTHKLAQAGPTGRNIMARKRHEEEEDNHERWLVSYADFITLLFAFFVVMYAISSVNEGKYKVFSNSLITAFNPRNATPATTNVETPPTLLPPLPIAQRRAQEALRREKDHMTAIARDLKRILAPLVREGKVRVTQNALGVNVEINASVLFAPGEAKLSAESNQALSLVANLLRSDSHKIQVEGHTDNMPISNPVFASNWELSSNRASSVVRLFIDSGIEEERMTAVGHAANQPVAPNDSPDNRARNRRVNVTILTGMPDRAVEVPTP